MRLDHITPKQSDCLRETGRKLAEPQITDTTITYPIRGSVQDDAPTELLDDHRALEPPDPIPNSEVKRRIADGSVGLPHVRVGHRQAPIQKPRSALLVGVSSFSASKKRKIACVLVGKLTGFPLRSSSVSAHVPSKLDAGAVHYLLKSFAANLGSSRAHGSLTWE